MIESLERRQFLSSSLFKSEVTVQSGMVSNIVSGDFDGNGTRDLATNGGAVFLNNGHGAFKKVIRPFAYKPADATNGPLTVAADFNHDGMDDIAGMFAGGFSIFFARGRGLFHLPIGKSTLVGVPVVLDANNDGRLDIAVSCLNKLRILINNGRNSFDIHSYPAPADVNVGAGPMAAADFDRDGDVDLIGGNASSRTPI